MLTQIDSQQEAVVEKSFDYESTGNNTSTRLVSVCVVDTCSVPCVLRLKTKLKNKNQRWKRKEHSAV
jgi:hypothetical protein